MVPAAALGTGVDEPEGYVGPGLFAKAWKNGYFGRRARLVAADQCLRQSEGARGFPGKRVHRGIGQEAVKTEDMGSMGRAGRSAPAGSIAVAGQASGTGGPIQNSPASDLREVRSSTILRRCP